MHIALKRSAFSLQCSVRSEGAGDSNERRAHGNEPQLHGAPELQLAQEGLWAASLSLFH